MKYASSVPRWILGLIFFVFGWNGFLQFMPMPPDLPQAVKDFMGAMMATGYFFPVLKGTEIFGGFLLLINKWVPLSLVILAPITLNIFLFHFFLTPGDLLMALAMIVIHLYLGFQYRSAFKSLFS